MAGSNAQTDANSPVTTTQDGDTPEATSHSSVTSGTFPDGTSDVEPPLNSSDDIEAIRVAYARQRPTRLLGAMTILLCVLFVTIYLLVPVLGSPSSFYGYEHYERFVGRTRSIILGTAVVLFGTILSAYYLRTGRLPFLRARILSPFDEISPLPLQQSVASPQNISSSLNTAPQAASEPKRTRPTLAGIAGVGQQRSLPAQTSESTSPPDTANSQSPLASVIGVLDIATSRMAARLQRQIPELTKRGNVNLTWGIFFALGGMVALWWAAMHLAHSAASLKDWKTLLVASLPRVSLALIVELFSYFFLGLYRTSLSEIKYFENEITTAETRMLALRVAAAAGDTESLRSVLMECAKTERNFRLTKEESTVELEREKINNSFADKVLDRVGDILKK